MKKLISVLILCALLASAPVFADGDAPQTSRVADASQMTSVEDVVQEGMASVYPDELSDGVYEVSVDSSSSMFRIERCELTVCNGAMTAKLTMSSTSYGYLFAGTAEEAAAADKSAYLEPIEENGVNTFVLPVEALDAGIPCAAWSVKKELWYDRTLVFRSDSLPITAFKHVTTAESLGLADGLYAVDVTLAGGSGRAGVQSPTKLWIENGAATAEIVWSSANYDYMKVDGNQIDAEIVDGHSTCILPVAAFDRPLAVIADTTAMSQAHEIAYMLTFDSASIAAAETDTDPTGRMALRYADQFTVDYDDEGRALVTIGADRFLVVPEGVEAREEAGAAILQLPLTTVYSASSAAMDLFARLDALSTVRLTGTKREDWSLPEIQGAMDAGTILYAGKYATPDYELLLAEGTALAIENTMIYHSPETKEQLEALGIPVLVERSSYESHPLGRLEWIKLYGLLTGKTAEAEAFFNEQAELVEGLLAQESTGKTAAFFYLTASGGVNVRRPEDYVAKMIALAGGRYVFDDLADDGGSMRSTMNMQTEDFYVGAKDADVLLYNATIDGGMDTMAQLPAKADWLADFRAVRTGNVWCTEANLFQQTSGIAAMIDELHQVFSGAADETALQFFHKLG